MVPKGRTKPIHLEPRERHDVVLSHVDNEKRMEVPFHPTVKEEPIFIKENVKDVLARLKKNKGPQR
jgi:hypothetical protein